MQSSREFAKIAADRLWASGLIKPFFGFPLPEGWSFICPSCQVYKMRQQALNCDMPGYICMGPACKEDALIYRDVICGKWMSESEIKQFIGMEIVEG